MGVIIRDICVYEKEDLLRPHWVDDQVHYGEEQELASFNVLVAVIRANDIK